MIKSLTNKLLVVNLILVLLGVIIYLLIVDVEYSDDLLYFPVLLVLIFAVSSGGVFAGIVERKFNVAKTTIGIIGNSILLLILFTSFIMAIENY